MPKNILIIILLVVIILGFDCKKNPVAPPSQGGVDTTSHNWVFTIDTLGDGNGSVLNDVAIVSTDPLVAYAVGDIELKDSTGQYNPLIYNLARWNGNQWGLQHITVPFRGNPIIPQLYGIFSLSQNQNWLVGGMAIFGDGQSWIPYDVRSITGFDSLSFTKCWGSNPENMWYTGLNGSLAYNNANV